MNIDVFNYVNVDVQLNTRKNLECIDEVKKNKFKWFFQKLPMYILDQKKKS
jgi:hypothetical protein